MDENTTPSNQLKDKGEKQNETENFSNPDFSSFKDILDSIDGPVAILDKYYTYTYVNKAYCNNTGKPAEEILGKQLETLTGRDYFFSHVKPHLDSCIQGQKTGYIEQFNFGKQSAKYWLMNYSPHKDSKGNIQGIIATTKDISEEAQLRENIKQISNNWVNTINAIDDVLLIVNTNFEIEDINTRGLELFNKKYEEVIGQKCYQNLLHNEQSCETCPICKSFRSSKHEMVELYNDKTKSWYSIKSSPIYDEKQNVVRYIDIIRDISKYKTAEKVIREKSEEISLQNEEYESLIEELRQTNDVLLDAKEKAMESDQLKSAFLANLSHEIRTPMNGIIGFSQMLNSPDISREKTDFYTNIIITSGHRLLSILNDILDISKIEAGQIEIKIEPASINNLIDELFDFYTLNRNDSSVFLINTKGLTDMDSIVYCDKTKVYQILNNLINNAVKFTKQGTIEFGYTLKSTNLEFYVQDSGIGIPPELQTVIFERFRQGDLELTRQCGGTGLGLSISQKLVEIMGGKVWLNSAPGYGSTFYFTLPYVPAQIISDKTEEENLPIQLSESANRNTILVAEDDEINFLFLKEILSECQYLLIHATNGLEAINILKSNPEIKLVLMDLKMPVMNGFEAIKIIKQQFPEIPIIAQTAYTLQTEKEEVLKIGCTGYIAKPINKKLLLQLINNYVPA